MLAAEGNGLDGARPEARKQVSKLLQGVRAVRFASVKNGPDVQEHRPEVGSALGVAAREWFLPVDVTGVTEP